MPTLEFKGKQLIYAHHLTVPQRGLEVDAKKSLPPKGGKPSLDDNLIIHGDNLHALKALMPRYAGKVNCIYIDPPYNTGNEGWVYNDNVNSPLMQEWLEREVGTDDLERHDKWLCMMWPRLHLLRELLAEDGVIFISIDDNEQHRLRMMMDEVFGEGNFVAALHVEMSLTQGMKVSSAKKGNIVKNAEYVFIYAKNREMLPEFNVLYESRQWDPHYSIYYDKDTGVRTSLTGFIKNAIDDTLTGITDYKSKDIDILYSDNSSFRNFIISNAGNIYQDAMCETNFDLNRKQIQILDKERVLEIQTAVRPYYIFKNSNGVIRQLLSLEMAIGDTDDFKSKHGLRRIRGDWWRDYYKDMMNVAKEGKIEFKNGKKPVRLIKDLLKLIPNNDAIILDSFAGSGTTAHAVMALNKEDGGDRKFILVECEKYAHKITAERVRRVIKGVPKAKDTALKKGLGGSFTYCTLGEAFSIENILTGKHLPDYETLARQLFQTATGQAIDKLRKQRGKDGFFYETPDRLYYLIYEPTLTFLQSADSALNGDRAKRIAVAAAKKQKTAIVFATHKFIGQKELTAMRITFCGLPYGV